jgi:hypothetical protein
MTSLVERLRYTAEHGIFEACEKGMLPDFGEVADVMEALCEALETAKVLIGAKNDTLSESARQSNINEAWHVLNKAISKALES